MRIVKAKYQRVGGGHINRFNPSAFVCLSRTSAWISNAICSCHLCVQCLEVRGERSEVVARFVDSVRIVYRHCLNFLFRKYKRDRKDIPGNVPTIAKDLKTHTEYQEKYISTKVAGFNML